MGTTTNRRLQPPSPDLNRSRRGASTSLPESFNASVASSYSSSSSSSSSSNNSSKRILTSRSHSTTRSSRTAGEYAGEIAPARYSSSVVTCEAVARLLEQQQLRGSPRNFGSFRGVKSSATSPSAWALSPGRVLTSSSSSSSLCMTPPESPVRSAAARPKGGGGGVAGVLRYFKQKKVSPVQEEDYHRFRVFYNRLLQWRFVNARAEASMSKLKVNAEDKLFMVWLRVYNMRNYVMERRIEVQKLRQEIKLSDVLYTQMPLLNKWSKLDAKNYEALSKLTRKLHAFSVRLPFTHGVKADVMSVHEAMVAAIEAMDEIEDIIVKFLPRVEKILYQLTELLSMSEQELVFCEEIENCIDILPTLVENENSVRIHLVQKA
ncbi:PREDICTED: QWRF motif-containing protein 7 [Tarenaya hassleriana]|uniref:QWRF motif-containing protein 7 n=1 Tax=Tarenaya hassleriana TaxID=28532 RepID=UPI00053C9A75|nr:PREDICTED: QWRF motif-containing protein 7 [Tarenaya hassleriana]